jgi:tetratricopeptide (TPR) repeat protein/transcriptional regulator with XRE-family HTH domain
MSRPAEGSAAEPPGEFAGLLRELRTRAGLTQQELADAAGISLRRVNGLERGGAATPQRETVRLLADTLSLLGPERDRFETAARGRPLTGVPTAAAAAAAMRSLPRDVASFTGRQRELAQLAKSALAAGGVVSIHAIGGMAGVGKTALALHAAHQLADRFPGGQVFLPLHGHTPGQAPVAPDDALASLLLSVGIPPARVPPGLEARAALWRDQVADRPLLLVLDDAASSEQVRSLLPGSGGSLVLVTSRRHLSALDDATAVSLDTLPPDDAAALLVRLAGRPGLAPGDPGVRELTDLCGYLPLAIGMMARQLRHHPSWSASRRAADLTSARDRLALMETENLSVAAAFDLSYSGLSAGQQRMFRRLGLHPGADVDGYAAAALDDVALPAARRILDELYDQYLLAEPAQGRYRLHDLLREHARTLAGRLDPQKDRDAAMTRVLDYYQHTAAAANARITSRTRPEAAMKSGVPAVVPVLREHEQALAWARAERSNLLACLDYAAGDGQYARITALTAGVSGLLLHDGPWADAVARQAAAVHAAQHLGDRLAQANALVDLGYARRLTDDSPAAAQAYEQALGLYRDLGDRLGQANAVSGLGAVWYLTSDYPAAVQAHEEALGIYRDLGNRAGQASALNHLANVWRLADDYPAAAQALEQALRLFRDLDGGQGQADALAALGEVRIMTGDHPAAALALEEALGMYISAGDQYGQARVHLSLGLVRRAVGDYPAAVQALERALGLYRDLGSRRGQAGALLYLGVVRRTTGDYPAAAEALDQALGIFVATGDRGSEVEALNERGTLHRVTGDLVLARKCHQQSLELSREIASSSDEAHALAGLGRCALVDGDTAHAERLLRQALEIFRRIGAAEVPELLAELDALTGESHE